jgi:hypothetical protein
MFRFLSRIVCINFWHLLIVLGQGFAPIGEVLPPGVGYGGMEVVEEFYSGYGERPEQGMIERDGGEYLIQEFPLLSYFVRADFVDKSFF